MNNFNPVIPHSIPQQKVICGFTTRNGGVSPPPFNSLNLGLETTDNPRNIQENHRIVYRYLSINENQVALMKQVHGGRISVVKSGGKFSSTDGLITSKSNLMLGVLVADCIPLLLFDPLHTVIGAVHCGWRSVSACIAEKAVGIFTEEFKTHPEDVVAAMGPSAGSCCYEVGEDVAELLQVSSVMKRDENLYADLRAELCDHLLMAGLNIRNIEIFPDCTVCNEKLYFSHRRDNRNAGRMMGYIMMKDNCEL